MGGHHEEGIVSGKSIPILPKKSPVSEWTYNRVILPVRPKFSLNDYGVADYG